MSWLELKLPPPLVLALTGLLMWGLSLMNTPVPLSVVLRAAVAIALTALGIAIAASGLRAIVRANTTFEPTKPHEATALVTTGIYRRTRNPMYLGMLVILLAWAAFLYSPWSTVGPIVFVLYITRFQIIPEERVLTGLFGETYASYRSTVRRWV